MTASKGTVLVTAGFGNQAHCVIPRLRAAGFRVRAMRANDRPGPGPLDIGAHEVVIGDAASPADAARAMAGVDAVYHIGPTFRQTEREMGFNMIAQAREAGVGHFVFSSVLHPIASGLPQHAIKRDIEERLIESRLNFTILQPSDYMQMTRPCYRPDKGVFSISFDLDNRQALVDLDDVAQVVAKVIGEGARHHGATYELTSHDNLTAHEIASRISQVTGRPITPVRNPHTPESLGPAAAHFGARNEAEARYMIETLTAVSAWYNANEFIGNGNVLEMLLGRAPTSYLDFARKTWGDAAA